jgi:hypothetical protein
VGPDGTAYPKSPIAIVDRGTSPDVQAFIGVCNPALIDLVNGRRS